MTIGAPPPPPGSTCGRCGKVVPAWSDSCPNCGASVQSGPVVVEPTDSDPTWPEPVESPAIEGTALAGVNRAERFKRFVRAITLRVHRAGPTLAVTLELGREPALRAELPLELGITLVVPRSTFNGTPDVFVKLEEIGESVICSVPARGLHAGANALFVISRGDNYEEVQTVVS